MAVELYNDGNHKCVVFNDLVKGEGIQCNQFIIVDKGEGMLLDPGGNLTYKDLISEMSKFFLPAHTRYVFASHQDPDIVASANGWLLITDANILISQDWTRFIPHFCSRGMTVGRLIPIPHRGMNVELGQCQLKILPAHYLHTVGNHQIYDPLSKILFSGDVGASLVDASQAGHPIADFAAHLPNMAGFHAHYMSNNKVCRLWVSMIRQLDVEWIVPQHGASFKGKEMVNKFLDWLEALECGTDLMTEADYQVP